VILPKPAQELRGHLSPRAIRKGDRRRCLLSHVSFGRSFEGELPANATARQWRHLQRQKRGAAVVNINVVTVDSDANTMLAVQQQHFDQQPATGANGDRNAPSKAIPEPRFSRWLN
jgi:hypothetical protein